MNGHRIDAMSESELMAVRADVGMVFQEGALFDSLTVGDKVGYVTHQLRDAFYIATHEAVREQQRVTIRPIPERRATDVEFMMLKDGRIQFKGATRDRVRPRIPTSGPSFPNPPPPRER